MMSHELRSPLHAILGYSMMAQHLFRGSNEERLRLIEQHGRRLLQMVDQALTCSRGEAAAVELEPAPRHWRRWGRCSSSVSFPPSPAGWRTWP